MWILTNLKFENEELKKIIREMFETDKSITAFRILQIAGRENWNYQNGLNGIRIKASMY